MFADISQFEALASGQTGCVIGGTTIYNSALAPLLDQYCVYRRYCQSNYSEEVRREMFEIAVTPHTEFENFDSQDNNDANF